MSYAGSFVFSGNFKLKQLLYYGICEKIQSTASNVAEVLRNSFLLGILPARYLDVLIRRYPEDQLMY